MSEYENTADPSHEEYLQRIIKENQNNGAPFMERLRTAHDEVLEEFSRYWKQLVWNAPSMYQGLSGFIKEIDWSETWIQSILAVQACILLTLILFRNNMVVQNTVFILSGTMIDSNVCGIVMFLLLIFEYYVAVVIIYFADKLNAWGAENWEQFSKHDYFEPNGAFVSLLISAPLLLGMLLILINYSVHFMWTLVHMKKEQLKRQARQAKQRTQQGTKTQPNAKRHTSKQQKKKQ